MPIKVKFPLEREFHLAKSDEHFGNTDGATMITIKQATQGDFELVNDLTAEYRREYDGVTVKAIQRISFDDVRRRQVYLTMTACNLLADDEKSSLFVFKNKRCISESAFTASWSLLDPYIAEEIYEKVLEMNPLWDDRIPKSKDNDNTPAPDKSGEAES